MARTWSPSRPNGDFSSPPPYQTAPVYARNLGRYSRSRRRFGPYRTVSPWFFAVTILLLGVFCLADGTVKQIDDNEFMHNGTKVNATVNAYDAKATSCGRHSCWDLYYGVTYSAGAQAETAEFRIKATHESEPRPSRPTTLAVYYQNDDPANARVASSLNHSVELAAGGVSLIVGVVISGFSLRNYYRRRRSSAGSNRKGLTLNY